MKIKVKGNLESIRPSVDFYISLTSTSSHRTVESLRRYYYSRFLEDAKKGLKNIAEVNHNERLRREEVAAKSVTSVDVGGRGFLDAVRKVEGTVDVGKKGFLDAVNQASKLEENVEVSRRGFLDAVSMVTVEEVEGTSLDEEDVSGGFLLDEDEPEVSGTILDAIEVLAEMQKEGIKPAVGTDITDVVGEVSGTILDYVVIEKHERVVEEIKEVGEVEEITGTILDDIKIVEKVDDRVVEKRVEVEVSGTNLDEVKVPKQEVKPVVKVEEKTDTEVHGTYLEDIEVVEFESGGYDDFKEVVVEDAFDDFVEEVVEETKPKSNVISIADRTEVKIEDLPKQVPATVREFLKKYPGSFISEVEKYYPKKTIEKEIKMGKIYKKGSKLFI